MGLVIITKSAVFSAQSSPDYGYVVVRCTTSVSVDVLDTNATAWFVVNGSTTQALSANQTAVSIGSITVINTSNGLLCKWAVWVATIQKTTDGTSWTADGGDGMWDLGANNGVLQARLCGVFATQRPAVTDFGTGAEGNDYFLNQNNMNVTASGVLNTYTYQNGNGSLGPANNAYTSDYTQMANPHIIAPGNQRSMFFRIDTPTAVLDEYPRRFVIAVKAAGGSESW